MNAAATTHHPKNPAVVFELVSVFNMVAIALNGLLERHIDRLIPDFLVHDLDLNWASVAGLVDRGPDAAQFDYAVTHQAASRHDAWQWHGPIGDVETENSPAGAPNLRV